jgi:hypothetical protein
MRTTMDIEDDVLAAAKELARLQGTSAGTMVSRLLRAALSGSAAPGLTPVPQPSEGGVFRPFPAEGGRLVSNEQINRLRDEAGL